MGLSPDLLKGISDLGFESATPIQEKIIPLALNTQKDIIGLAQTGTGKTAAYGLPIIEHTTEKANIISTLVLSPTRELCVQISNDLNDFAKYINSVKTIAVYGGASIDTQIRKIKKGVNIIVGTPGRTIDLIKRKVLNLSNIDTLILDEADEMLNMGFRDELDEILKSIPSKRRTMLFSATMPNDVANITKKYMKNPEKITIGKKNIGAENIEHIYYQVIAKNKYLALKRIADINPNIYGIIFCRTRTETKDIAAKLAKDGYNADALHGDLSQSQRDNVMDRFRRKDLQLLVATDVASRGIDVDDITHIINYNLPEENDIYTHRSGRTGRAGKSGISISIINYKEKGKINQIEKIINKKFQKKSVPNGLEICNQQLITLIQKIRDVNIDEQQIKPFMEFVNEQFNDLDREEIIKKFVSLEFNRFLEYYKDAPDLNDNKLQKNKDIKSKTSSRRSNGIFERFFINLGKKDKLDPRKLIDLINKNTKNKGIKIGDIDIKDNFSFFETDKNYSNEVINSLSDNSYNKRSINVEIAEKKNNKRKKKK